MKNNKIKFFSFFACLLMLAAIFILPQNRLSASQIDELRQKIDENNAQIAALQKEIEELQKQLDQTGKDAKTLKNQISQLETTIKKLQTDTKITQKKINSANLIIEELNIEIKGKEQEIYNSKNVLAEIIRNMEETESQSLVEILLANTSLSEFFDDLEHMEDFQSTIGANLQQLKTLKEDFQNQQAKKESEKNNLEDLQSQLADQQTLVQSQKNQKNTTLAETKNKEANYQKLLADRLAKQQALENEISAYEEQIRVEIDPSSLPKTGSGVLQWPLDNPVITQYFGNTPFATQNPQVYGGKGHDGIDLRAPVGTPIKAARLGVVTAIGNTVSYCRGYQIGYGGWVLIQYDNNISTFYVHLTRIKVSPGDSVETGQLVGYSGNTGYTTGPHLHFGVFATQAIVGLEYKSTSQTCGGIIMRQPIVPPNGKLNPLSYL